MTTHFQHMHITAKTVRLMGAILIVLLFSSLTVIQAQAAPLRQTGCTLPATVTTTTELSACITAANSNGAGLDTITLGADITLTAFLPQITTAITLEGANHVIDGGNSVRIFTVNSSGDFTVNQATLQNGSASSGGGIDNDGTLMVTNSTLSGNSAVFGGGISNDNDGTLTVINSTFSGNSANFGGGISNESGTLTVTNSTFSGNIAEWLESGSGGGIYNSNPGTLTVTNSTFSGNVVDYGGGGIYNNFGALTVTNSTFSGNSATTSGGGLYNNFGTAHLAGNIFADSTGGNNCANQPGTFNDNGYNLSDDASCVNGGSGSVANATLNLGALADNGGLTQTHLPGAGSAAINAIPFGYVGNNNGELLACNRSTTDQIGHNRPLIPNTACTSGAVEVASPVATLTIVKDASPAVGTDFNFTINSEPLTDYSGSTSGKPFWTRPNEGGTCTLSSNSVRYHVQAFVVNTSGNYSMVGVQNYNGYLHLYQDSFDPLDQCANYLNGDDDSGLGSNQSELSHLLEPGTVYYLVTSGFASANAGTFTNTIFRPGGGGNAYTLYDSFPLDDAVPDDNDGVNAGTTFNVTPGTYAVTEAVLSGWDLTGATCTGAGGSVSLTGETLSVEVSDGETVQCTFTNETLCPASWTVTTADELSGCITLANANESPSPTADTIFLGADIDLTTLTTSPLPNITSAITLEGANHVIDGGWDGVPGSGTGMQIFHVGSNFIAGDLTVNQVTLQNGETDAAGGSIYIRSNGTLEVTNSTISGNSALTAGGIFNNGGTLEVTNSTLSGNSASNDGGGIYNNGTLMVSGSTLSGNIAANAGGGIFNNGTQEVTNSTLSGNSAANAGGGIYNSNGPLTVTNSTFSGNSTPGSGDGVYSSTGPVYLAGNILADSTSGDNCTGGGTFNDNGYNLSDDGTCVNGGTGSANNATLNLGALADNGGPTLTHLPGAGSDAIGAIPNGTTINNNGSSWTCDQSATDQRSELRPINSGDGCTAGAVEVIPICTSWTVTTADELSDCITLANGNESPSPTADTIILGADIDLTALTTSPLPNIMSAITLEGANHVIDGGWDGVPGSGTGIQIFQVGSDFIAGNLTVKQVTLQNGEASAGGGIVIKGNGTLAVTNSTISGNSANTAGGIYNSGGTLSVTGSTFSGNRADHGGGIYTSNNGTLTVAGSTFSGNMAGFGGGINNSGGTVTVTNSTFSGNTAASFYGGGIHNQGTATVTGSTFSGNSARFGGGMNIGGGTLTVTNSTFSGNSANYGGGINIASGTLTVTNSTLSGNEAAGYGGGILNNSTTHLAGTIFAAGPSGANCVNFGTLNDNGYNLADDASCSFGGTSADNATLNLGALADNGGPTETHALLSGSDAINVIPYDTTINNNGSSWTCNDADPFTDQRGVTRPQGAGCDSGAYEVAASQTGPDLVVNTDADTDDGFCDLLGQGTGNQDCTLREAINAANAHPDASEITFAGDYTIILTAQLPFIASEITINGVGHSVTVDGNSTYTVFAVLTDSALTMNSLTLAHGYDTVINFGDLTVLNSTLRDGAGEVGGIYSGGSQLIIANSTFYNNAGSNTGAVQADGSTNVLNNVTLSGNSGGLAGGVYTYFTAVTINNSIITNSTGGDCATDGGSFSGSNNLIDDNAAGACAGISSASVTNLAASPADNGGDTHTIALLVGSNALDAGNNATCEATDQRGVARPQMSGCDAGAYELEMWRLTITAVSANNVSLSWVDVQAGCTYDVFESTTPYFTPTEPAGYPGVTSPYVVNGRLGTVGTDYFFVNRATCNGETVFSNEVGEFDFALVPGN